MTGTRGRGDPPTLDQVIARGVREARLSRGLTQEALARRLREGGFTGWTRGRVAALETRRRAVSAGDLLSLAIALGVRPADLVRGGPPAVRLDDGSEVELERLRRSLQNKLATVRRTLGIGGPVLDARGELERRLAARLGVDPLVVAGTAHRLWGRSATAERDARTPAGSPVGVRRHVSRAIRREIEEALPRQDPGRGGPPSSGRRRPTGAHGTAEGPP